MEKDSWCHYSDLPAPNAYGDITDYDGMGNHSRMPSVKVKKNWKNYWKRILARFLTKAQSK